MRAAIELWGLIESARFRLEGAPTLRRGVGSAPCKGLKKICHRQYSQNCSHSSMNYVGMSAFIIRVPSLPELPEVIPRLQKENLNCAYPQHTKPLNPKP